MQRSIDRQSYVLNNIKSRMQNTLERTDFSFLGDKYEGKVRDNYTRGNARMK